MAILRASWYGASALEPAGATAEVGVRFNRADDLNGTTEPVPIPSATGTNYSWFKNLALEVTTLGASSISNRRISLLTTPATGLHTYYKVGAYVRPTALNKPSDALVADFVPSSYAELTTTPVLFDATAIVATPVGRNGDMVQVVGGVSNNYGGPPVLNTAMPTIRFHYDEA